MSVSRTTVQSVIHKRREADPRYNAADRLSDLYGDERRRALSARHEAHAARYMDRFRQVAAASPEPPSHSILAVLAWPVFIAGVVVLLAVVS